VHWVAVYTDGSTLEQYDSEGGYHKSSEVQADRLDRMEYHIGDAPAPILVRARPGREIFPLVYRETVIGYGSPGEMRVQTAIIRFREDGRDIVLGLQEDGTILLESRPDRIGGA
jgi:hypothetical protein